MGGVTKILGLQKKAAPAIVEAKKSQAVQAGLVQQDSADRNQKRATTRGKKRLQIPTTSTTTGVSTSGGTGLNTGA